MPSTESVLQREIGQAKPFDSFGQEAFLGVIRTADVLSRLVNAIVEPHGITGQQYNVLRILRGAGEAGLPTLAIRERMVERTPGITGLIDRLQSKGWVERRRRREDRRQILCRITAEGLTLLATLDEPINRIDSDALGMLSDSELSTLIGLLDRIRRYHADRDRASSK